MALGNANTQAQSRGKNKAVVVKRRKEVVLAADYKGTGDPIMRLRERLLISKATRQGGPNTTAICAMVIKAWNAFIRGRSIGPLHWSQNGERPEKFPKAIARSRIAKLREVV